MLFSPLPKTFASGVGISMDDNQIINVPPSGTVLSEEASIDIQPEEDTVTAGIAGTPIEENPGQIRLLEHLLMI